MESKIIYLDNASTTKPCSEAVEAMLKSAECYGNPSSLHGIGLQAEKLIDNSRKIIASKLGADKSRIYFTSGGTEANNTAIFGTAYSRIKQGKHIVTTSIEHPSVLECFRRLQNEGFDVTYLTADKDGRINCSELEQCLTPETTLVSIMHVNNETGVIQPVEHVKEIIRRKSPAALFHTDCVQSFGKLPVLPNKWGADLVTISAHKIHAFKGTGALYMADDNIKPLIFGGEQQKQIRPGTENTGGIMAFGAAADKYNFDADKMKNLRLKIAHYLQEEIDDIIINGSDEYNSGSVLNVSVLGIKAEVLLHVLESRGIYVSTGSACSSHKPSPSHVLSAMGRNAKEISGAIRISFSEYVADDDVDYIIAVFKKEIKNLRRYMR